MWWNDSVNISELLGKTIISIEGMEKDCSEIYFNCSDDTRYMMYHDQNCCESVYIEDVCGNVEDLLNTPITLAEDISNECDEKALYEWDDSYTWTYYKFATVKGYVTIRWYGTSNGYYSESVDFVKVS